MRISRPEMFMQMAQVVAKRATCFRLNVGAVITVDNRVVSIGYNGSPPGEPHCLGNECPGAQGCHLTIHAEDNALRYVPESVQGESKDLYVTDSPCPACVDRILESATIARVFFATPYRDTSALDKLIANRIEVYRILPSGYIVEWETGQLVTIP